MLGMLPGLPLASGDPGTAKDPGFWTPTFATLAWG
jgi:hypothetical protein